MSIVVDSISHPEPETIGRNEKIVQYLPFVHKLAHRIAKARSYSLDVDELIQNGSLGLMEAVDTYDDSRGRSFLGFAEIKIRGRMADGLRRDYWPRDWRKLRNRIEEAKTKLERELGEAPSVSQIASELEVEVDWLIQSQVKIRTLESLTPLENRDISFAPEAFRPKPGLDPDQILIQRTLIRRIRNAILQLEPRDRKVIVWYYYLEIPQKEIGVGIGVGESRISQVLARALKRLRELLDDETG